MYLEFSASWPHRPQKAVMAVRDYKAKTELLRSAVKTAQADVVQLESGSLVDDSLVQRESPAWGASSHRKGSMIDEERQACGLAYASGGAGCRFCLRYKRCCASSRHERRTCV